MDINQNKIVFVVFDYFVVGSGEEKNSSWPKKVFIQNDFDELQKKFVESLFMYRFEATNYAKVQ